MSLLYLTSTIIVFLSITFTQMFHPLAMGFTLLLQTVMICMTSGLSSKTTWFSYMLFLIFLGAMLVLFIYVASLASNESFTFPLGMVILLILLVFLSLSLTFTDPLMMGLKTTVDSASLDPNTIFSSTPALLSGLYNPASMNLTMFIILYLLLTLIVVVNITHTFHGPLRPH